MSHIIYTFKNNFLHIIWKLGNDHQMRPVIENGSVLRPSVTRMLKWNSQLFNFIHYALPFCPVSKVLFPSTPAFPFISPRQDVNPCRSSSLYLSCLLLLLVPTPSLFSDIVAASKSLPPFSAVYLNSPLCTELSH